MLRVKARKPQSSLQQSLLMKRVESLRTEAAKKLTVSRQIAESQMLALAVAAKKQARARRPMRKMAQQTLKQLLEKSVNLGRKQALKGSQVLSQQMNSRMNQKLPMERLRHEGGSRKGGKRESRKVSQGTSHNIHRIWEIQSWRDKVTPVAESEILGN